MRYRRTEILRVIAVRCAQGNLSIATGALTGVRSVKNIYVPDTVPTCFD